MGARRKKRRTHVPIKEDDVAKVPKSFVFRSGIVDKSVAHLVHDIRKVMEPNTASNLRERKSNKLKDFVHVASQFGVSHFIILSETDIGTNMRIARHPRGPTLHFRVEDYTLTREVVASQMKPKAPSRAEFSNSPLLVLNNFGDDSRHMKLMVSMFQNMFPAINVQTMKLSEARRVLLFSYDKETGQIEVRHYSIGVSLTGVSKSVKRIVQANIPDLHNFEDIGDFILRGSQASESDVEDGPETTVTLSQNFVGRNNRKSEQRAIRLSELGPRMTLQLVKIQEGMCDGEVLYHEFVKKTTEEVANQRKEFERKKAEKEARRKEQEANVERKAAEKEARKTTGGEKRKRVSFGDEDGDSEADGKESDEDEEDESEIEEEDEDQGGESDEDVSEGLSDAGDESEEEPAPPPKTPVRPPGKGKAK